MKLSFNEYPPQPNYADTTPIATMAAPNPPKSSKISVKRTQYYPTKQRAAITMQPCIQRILRLPLHLRPLLLLHHHRREAQRVSLLHNKGCPRRLRPEEECATRSNNSTIYSEMIPSLTRHSKIWTGRFHIDSIIRRIKTVTISPPTIVWMGSLVARVLDRCSFAGWNRRK